MNTDYKFKIEIDASEITDDLIQHFRDFGYGLIVIRNADNDTVEKFGELLPQDMYGRKKVTIGHDDEHGERLQHTHDMLWHQDRAYHKDVHPYVGLYCLIAEQGSSKTYFADMSDVYKSAPQELKDKAEDMVCINSITKYMAQEEYPYEFKSEAHRRAYRLKNRTKHPLVWEDNFGKFFFFCAAYTETDLEDEIQSLVEKSEVYKHEWEPNDLLVYNNYKIIHKRDETDSSVIRKHVRYAFK